MASQFGEPSDAKRQRSGAGILVPPETTAPYGRAVSTRLRRRLVLPASFSRTMPTPSSLFRVKSTPSTATNAPKRDHSAATRAACRAARMPAKCSFHGLRKAACRRLAEAGCSVNEIAAISGHATLREVQRYTQAVDQERMTKRDGAAGERLGNIECQTQINLTLLNVKPLISEPLICTPTIRVKL
jgi:integrase